MDEAFNKTQAVYDAALKHAQTVVEPSDTVSDEVYDAAVEQRDNLGVLLRLGIKKRNILKQHWRLETLEEAMGKPVRRSLLLSRLNDLAKWR